MKIVPWTGRDLEADYNSGSNDPVAVRAYGKKVHLQVQNGGDFGDSDVYGTPEEARSLAVALLMAAAEAEKNP